MTKPSRCGFDWKQASAFLDWRSDYRGEADPDGCMPATWTILSAKHHRLDPANSEARDDLKKLNSLRIGVKP